MKCRKNLIFGAGMYGCLIAKSILKKGETLVGFIDNNSSIQGMEIKVFEESKETYKIYAVENILKLEFERIIIATVHEKFTAEIKEQLADFVANGIEVEAITDSMELRTDALAQIVEYKEYEDQRVSFIRDVAKWMRERNIEGAVAECGVWMGDLSYYINKYYPDRTCYLFDTFEGFSDEDISKEFELNDSNFVEGPFATEMHFKTEVDQIQVVEKKLLHLENCIIKKGYFPESANGLDDRFCFVNLDMDLYAPMYAGLEFFYEKMSTTGVLLLHDYFNEGLPGVKKAVEDFEMKIGRYLVKVPIGDGCSIAIIKDEM